MPRRFLAPNANGEVFAEPGFDAIPSMIWANRLRLDDSALKIAGLPLREFRRLAYDEVVYAARDYMNEMGEWAPGSLANRYRDFPPLLLAGHQPELSHPGVWVKNFALNGLAKRVGGIALNLIVDNDTLKSSSLHLPVFQGRDPSSVHRESVKFDQLETQTYEDRVVIDAEMFRTFPERVTRLTANWGFDPLLPKVWLEGRNIGEAFTRMRRERERDWGCDNLELPVSRLSQTESFRRFAQHILDDLPRFRAAYNAAIRAYRQVNRIRSANHPAPELEPHEAPFWDVSTRGRRRPATASTQALRPRALTLTLFARLALGDFFIHGIGGGKYDEVTDTIIRSYFGIDPPAYQVLSATLHLPLPEFDATDEDLTQAQRAVRDLHWNPQRHVVPPARDDPLVLRLVADRIELASNEPSEREARREWYRRLQAMNETLRPHLGEQMPLAKSNLDRIVAEARSNAILTRRDYSWVLYPEATLRPFLQRFLV